VQTAARDIETSVSSAARDVESGVRQVESDLNATGAGGTVSLAIDDGAAPHPDVVPPLTEPIVENVRPPPPAVHAESSRQASLPGFDRG
jgi:hypothetical protein